MLCLIHMVIKYSIDECNLFRKDVAYRAVVYYI